MFNFIPVSFCFFVNLRVRVWSVIGLGFGIGNLRQVVCAPGLVVVQPHSAAGIYVFSGFRAAIDLRLC